VSYVNTSRNWNLIPHSTTLSSTVYLKLTPVLPRLRLILIMLVLKRQWSLSLSAFLNFCHTELQLPDITANDISVCHRLKKNARDRARRMIVCFTTRKARSLVLSARKKIRGSPTFINEHLTKPVSDLLASTRRLLKQKKIQGTWTWNCKLFIKLLDGTIKIVSAHDDIIDL